MSQDSRVGSDSNFSQLLGMTIVKAADGESEIRMGMQEQLLNLHGKMHGGAIFSLLDTALGQASHSLFDGRAGSVTLECKINYIRGVSEGEIVARAKVVNAGRKVHVLEAQVHQGEKLVAMAQATFAVL
ncbi:PaaI family thioesterase [Pseudomonas sp. PDM14]|uniref:PaaI family thioesterase n=1 Tax=Pseudomonas sp. PDM14 TaxID=2769288 RepID=UPI00177C823A|nr:PaaI family thioesterase [Pseudomonas sp. PDM14]MBD9483015.1 PaaI family thioesterase [Pseudomonas sp. PDM14]